MTVQDTALRLAVNGREHQLVSKLVELPAQEAADPAAVGTVAVIGLGYVGLPTALALTAQGVTAVGVDPDPRRREAITNQRVDLAEADRSRLAVARRANLLRVTGDIAEIDAAETIIICVPTPVDGERAPDPSLLREACGQVIERVLPGQTVILTSTSSVGTTEALLAAPLRARGHLIGDDVFVAFSPERIDPGNTTHVQRETPRVVGGITDECALRAGRVIGAMADSVYLVSSTEAAELTKLYENIFRAVSLALANEFADVCGHLDLDPIEVTLAAGTKPYGFLGAFPGPGVGGHCIPCDPYYLLSQLPAGGRQAPLLTEAMRSIGARPDRVVQRARATLHRHGRDIAGAKVLLVGVSYKAGVQDLRESPALPIISGLRSAGAQVRYYDPLLPEVVTPDGTLYSEQSPETDRWDLAVMHTLHPGLDYEWARRLPLVLDATYQFDGGLVREVV